MNRTQIYLAAFQHQTLSRLAQAMNLGKSQLIRRAIDEFLTRPISSDKLRNLRAARGMWTKRKDHLDVRKIRSEFDRF